MLNKMNEAVNTTINQISWEENNIQEFSTKIRESVEKYNDYEMIEFIPNMLETLKKAIERKRSLEEQLQILKYIQREN
ncbi:MAG: hypothetical protein HFE90_03180 [Firmicutes bacterium]|nr:hypothetical protein [Bacillota bacterium]